MRSSCFLPLAISVKANAKIYELWTNSVGNLSSSFTVAHEIGHVQLPDVIVRIAILRLGGGTRAGTLEWLARWSSRPYRRSRSTHGATGSDSSGLDPKR